MDFLAKNTSKFNCKTQFDKSCLENLGKLLKNRQIFEKIQVKTKQNKENLTKKVKWVKFIKNYFESTQLKVV